MSHAKSPNRKRLNGEPPSSDESMTEEQAVALLKERAYIEGIKEILHETLLDLEQKRQMDDFYDRLLRDDRRRSGGETPAAGSVPGAEAADR